jgi:hypothetical protein
MRKLLLAGVALAGAAAVLPAAAAFAQESPVFPETTRAGKLNGAAPGSVQVSIGGTLFSAIWFASRTGQNDDNVGKAPVTFLNYIRLYPNFDYASPSGVHFGLSGEIRSTGAAQGENRVSNKLYWHSAFAYVSSDRLGKFEVGTPNGAIGALAVGLTDDFNTGGFYGEYGFSNGVVNWAFADAYDGNGPKQKIAYISPSFAGFTFGVSFQPVAQGLNNSSVAAVDFVGGAGAGSAALGTSKNRVEVALKFGRNFGGLSVNANVGYAHANPISDTVGVGFRDVNQYDAGIALGYGGFVLEAHYDGGQYSYANTDDGSPFGPALKGSHSTQSFAVAPEYSFGKFTMGASYIWYNFDASQAGLAGAATSGPVGKVSHASGFAAGGSYVVGPGVSLYLDILYGKAGGGGADWSVPGSTIARTEASETGVGIGTYFSF